MLVARSCLNLCDPWWTAAHQAPLPMRFSRQGYWSGLPFPSPGDLPNSGIESGFLHCMQILYQLSYKGSPIERLCSKSFKLGFSNMWTENFQMYKLSLEKAEEPEIKLPTFITSQRKQEDSRKTSTSASLTTLKLLTVWVTRNCGKFLKRWKYQTT